MARRSAILIRFLAVFVLAGVFAFAAPTRARAELAVETNDVLEFNYQQSGATEEEAVRLACIRAVRATVGRVLFSNYSLQARDLLGPYIEKNWNKFVASDYVLERRFDRDGFGCRIRVQTYPEWVTRDLREKKFLYLPERDPYYAVFIGGTLAGAVDPLNQSRLSVINELKNNGARVQESVMLAPGYVVDVNVPESIHQARIAAIQAGAELIIAGRVDTQRVAQENVYLDNVSTFETTLNLSLIRVDDGRVLGNINTAIRTSGIDPNQAQSDAIKSAMGQATSELIAKGKGLRGREVFDKTKFSLMFTDVTEDEVKSVSRFLQSQLSYGTKVYVRSWFGNVGVLNVDTDRAWPAVERALINFRQFDLRVADVQGHRVTVDCQH